MSISDYTCLKRRGGKLSDDTETTWKLDVTDITEREKNGGGAADITLTSGAHPGYDKDRKFHDSVLLIRRRINAKREYSGMDLEIQSPIVQKAIKTTCQNCVLADPIVISKPYYTLHHFRTEIEKYIEEAEDIEETKHLNVLSEFMRKHLMPLQKAKDSLVDFGRISFPYIQMIYRPGCLIIGQKKGIRECYLLQGTDEGKKENSEEPELRINAFSWRYDGTKFGPVLEKLKIEYFSGPRKIRELDYFPVEFLPQEAKDACITELIDRGRKWCKNVENSHQEYKGPFKIVPRDPWSRKEITDLDPSYAAGRILLDHKTFIEKNGQFEVILHNTGQANDLDDPGWNDTVSRTSKSGPQRNNLVDGDINHSYPTEDYSPDDLQALLCPGTSPGYSLVEKKWGFFDITKAEDISWSKDTIGKLEINPDTKSVLRTLVHHHYTRPNTVEDLVAGKGKGLIFLLHGEPGSGKTATAEAIAEQEQRPLYCVSSGELGEHPWTADREVRQVFNHAKAWNAVLLIDEADVYLRRRSDDIQRNSLVSIFLRNMEYFSGVLFLTTNRREDFDDAAMSRIKLKIFYPALSADQRTKIWWNNLQDKPSAKEWSIDVCRKYGEGYKLNGREIWNLLSTSLALADESNEPLTQDLVEGIYSLMFPERIVIVKAE